MFGKKNKLNLLSLYAEEVKEEVIDVLSWRRRQRSQRLILFLNYAVWLLVVILVVLIANVLIFLPSFKKIYWQALAGKGALEKTSALFDKGSWQELAKMSAEAENDFSNALGELKKIRFTPLGWLPFTHDKLNDGIYLLRAGSSVSRSLANSSKLIDEFFSIMPDKVAFNLASLDKKQKRDLIKLIADSQNDLAQAKDDLAQAKNDLAKIKNRQLLINQGLDLDELALKIKTNEDRLSKAWTLSKVLPILGGYGEPAKYLFVLQNNDELRPTGGFIGTYGLAKMTDGDLSYLSTSDVYHLDMPAKDSLKIEPPAELKKYLGVDNWYLRDANWSPDWQQSAKKIAWFYTQENKLSPQPSDLDDFKFIIGLTPKAIIDLLGLTGPITVRGLTYDQSNFMALLQDSTGRDYSQLGLSSWDRKSIIGDITKSMQTKIFADLNNAWPKLLEIVSLNLDEKNILIYTTDQTIYQLAKDNDWLGEIKQTAGDYCMVVDANMAALKTDAVVSKSLVYNLQETDDGLVAHLKINYGNSGKFSWKTTRYRTFTRVYVPKGSQLIKAAGHVGDQADVVVGEELGRTYFGAFVEIEPGKIGGLSFDYKLPYTLYDSYKNGNYELLFQKQPGTRISQINLDFQFKKSIKDYEPAIFYSYISGNRFVYKSDFLSDKNISLKF